MLKEEVFLLDHRCAYLYAHTIIKRQKATSKKNNRLKLLQLKAVLLVIKKMRPCGFFYGLTRDFRFPPFIFRIRLKHVISCSRLNSTADVDSYYQI